MLLGAGLDHQLVEQGESYVEATGAKFLDYLKKMPDYRNTSSIETIVNKSSVLPLGCELNFHDKK